MTILALLAVLVAAPDRPADPLAAVGGQIKKVNATHYVVPRQAVDRMLSEAPRWSIRIMPELQDDKVVALKLVGVAPDSAAARLGFREGDVVRTVNGFPLNGPADVLQAYAKTKDAPKMRFAISRAGKPLAIEWRIVGGHANDWDTPPREERASAASIEERNARIGKLVAQIGRVDDRHYTVPRAARDGLLVTPDLGRSWRIQPLAREGQFVGMRLLGLTPQSLPTALGLVDGDIVLAVNGVGFSGPDGALAVHRSLRAASPVRIAIERAGKPVTIEVAVK